MSKAFKSETRTTPIALRTDLLRQDYEPASDGMDLKSVRAKRDRRWMELKLKHGTAVLKNMTHKVWRTAGGSKERPSHKAANGQKVGINEHFNIGGHKMFLPSDPDAPWAEIANCRCDVEYLKEGEVVGGADTNFIAQTGTKPNSRASALGGIYYRLKNSSVTVPSKIEPQVRQLARDYFARTGKYLTITDGPRTPNDQAKLMYTNRSIRSSARQPFDKFYRNTSAAKAIEAAYQAAKAAGKLKNDIIADMERVIAAQVARGVYISAHLDQRAVDIRLSDMNANEQKIFRQLASSIARLVLREGDHWHISF